MLEYSGEKVNKALEIISGLEKGSKYWDKFMIYPLDGHLLSQKGIEEIDNMVKRAAIRYLASQIHEMVKG